MGLYKGDCLDTSWVSSAGNYVDKFEESISSYTGSKYAIACVNGTSALQLSLRLVGVKSGDEVMVPTLTFIAPINAVRHLDTSLSFLIVISILILTLRKQLISLK